MPRWWWDIWTNWGRVLYPPHYLFATTRPIFKVAIKREQTKLAWSLPSVSNFGRRPIFNVESTLKSGRWAKIGAHLPSPRRGGDGVGWNSPEYQKVTDPTPAPPLEGRGWLTPRFAQTDFFKWTQSSIFNFQSSKVDSLKCIWMVYGWNLFGMRENQKIIFKDLHMWW